MEKEFVWAVQRIKGKVLITKILKIGWNAYIYCIWKERNKRVFVQIEECKANIGANKDNN